MLPEQFCYWLHGYSEITNRRLPNETEWKIINDHLDLVFKKETPNQYGIISGSIITNDLVFRPHLTTDFSTLLC